MKENLVGLAIAIAAITLIIVAAAIIVGMSGSIGATQVSDTKAHVESDGRLSLSWIGKAFYDIHREGSNVVVASLLTERYPLCGPGCTIEVPFGFREKLVITENADRSLTIEWPWSYSMY